MISPPSPPKPVRLHYKLATVCFICLLALTTMAKAEDQQQDTIVETIVIDETEYIIPEQWLGQKLKEPYFTPASFAQIPRSHTVNESSLYLISEAQTALVRLLKQAELDGIHLLVHSAYRSRRYQKKIFIKMIRKGRTFEDIVRYVAPPGYSEHMLGTAVDFYPSNWRFASTDQYKWLKENGGKFDFYETYSENNRAKKPWESWHWKYIGASTTPDILTGD